MATPNSKHRSLRAAAVLRESQMGPGFSAYSLRGLSDYPLDPFLNFDDFRMSIPTFPPHPHAGFSAVTYMFEDSPGAFINRDSLGDKSRIGPGALHWTQAARGMMHEEIPESPGTVCHGLQTFVNLRSDHKQAPPRAWHLDPGQIPEVKAQAGAKVRVLVGTFGGATSPLRDLYTKITLLDVSLAKGAQLQLPISDPTCVVMTRAGSGALGPQGQTPLEAHQGLGLAADGDHLTLTAGPSGLQLLLAAGTPIGEPVVFGGPFAMTNKREIEDANARFRRGEMGRLEPSF